MSGMQRQDYKRISTAVRTARRAVLEDVANDDPVRGELRDAFQEVAMQLARAMFAVNRRFRYAEFVTDCLGHHDAESVVKAFREEHPDAGPGRPQ